MSLAIDLAREFIRAYLPLERALGSGYEFRLLLKDMGWHVDLAAVTDQAVEGLLGVGLDDLSDAVTTIVDTVENPASADLGELAEAVEVIHDAVTALGQVDPGSLFPADAGDLADPDFWLDLAASLPEYLIVRWLRSHHGTFHGLLRFAGVIEDAERTDLLGQPAGSYERLVVERLGQLVDGTALPTTYGWDGNLDHGRLVEALLILANRLGLRADLVPIHPAFIGTGAPWADGDSRLDTTRAIDIDLVEVVEGGAVADAGLAIVPVPDPGRSDPVEAVLATIRASGQVSWTFDLIENIVTLTVAASADATGAAGIVLSPHGAVGYGTGVEADLAVELDYTPVHPFRFPAEGRPALEIGDVAVGGGLVGSLDSPGLELNLSLLDAVIELAAADGFLAALLGDAAVAIPLDLDLAWSTDRGFTVGGSVGLGKVFVLEKAIGPVVVETLGLELRADLSGGLELSVDTLLAGFLGPFTVGADGLGLALALTPADDGRGSLGPFELTLDPVWPTTVTFELESEAVSGGGFVTYDPDAGRYAGGLALDILGMGISAIVIVDTMLPGGADGFALFASLGATFAQPIPIGFGFTLNGVGGVLALNRTIDGTELAKDLKTGAADSLLFPEDILGDAGAVLAGLDRWMPIQTGSTIFGPVVEIGWGNPAPVINVQLGVMIVLPDLLISLLGSVEMLLPNPEEPVLTLNMDLYGEIDLLEGTVLVVASLYDSNLLGLYELSGDMGFYADFTGGPFFVLSVGGYHPSFKPPGALPEAVSDLREMRAAIDLGDNVEISATAYVAVTSSSFQFGGAIDVYASVRVLGTTFTATGWFSVDLLLQFAPFKLVASATFGAGIYVDDAEILVVDLSAHIEGPDPWFASGRAYFSFLGFKVNFEFDVGSKPGGLPPGEHPVSDDVVAAMVSDEAWIALAPSDGWAVGTTLTSDLPAGLWVGPDQLVEVRQSIAPLNRVLDRFGEAAVPDVEEIEATNVRIGPASIDDPDWAEDWFAPAQFDDLGDGAKLSSPSYELMTGGVRFGDSTVGISPLDGPTAETTSVTRTPETDVVLPELDGYFSPLRFSAAPPQRRTVVGPILAVGSTTYTVVRESDGVLAEDFMAAAGLSNSARYRDVVAAVDRAGNVGTEVRVVPSHAVMEDPS